MASETSQEYPEPIVGALVLNSAGQMLLVRSHKWHDTYGLPGGHIELGETMIDAVRREVKEETDLDVDEIDFLCFQELVFDDAFWTKSHFIFFDFVCITANTKVKLNEESEDYLWIEPQEATEIGIDPYTRNAILEYLNTRR